MFNRTRLDVPLWCAVFLATTLVGCSDGPQVYPVRGTVTRGGKPVPGLTLNFMPENGRPSWAVTNDEGRYELHYSKDYEGGVIGKHRVFVAYEYDQAGKPPALDEDRKAIVARYGDQSTSPLTAEISNSGQVVDFTLD